MLINDNTMLTRPCKGSVAAIGLRLLVILACVSAFGISSAFGQSAEYSDSYTIDNSGTQTATDPTTGESMTATPDNAGNPALVGVGVSEADYNSYTYSTDSYTTLTSPSGAVSIAGYSDGYTYARDETGLLQLDPDNAEEGNYQVTTRHTYYQDRQDPGGCQPGRICTASNNSSPSGVLFANASYMPMRSLSPVHARSAYLGYYTSYSFFGFGVHRIFSGGVLRYGDDTCRAVWGISFPYTYIKACADGGSGCPRTYFLCGAQPHYGVQTITFRVDYYFSYYCAYTTFRYIGTAPYCRN